MLNKLSRLVKDREIAQIYKKGKRTRSQNLNLIYLETNQNNSRFGFVVSKKQASRIVDRNRIKRRLRAQIRRVMPSIAEGFDVIISGKKSTLDLTDKELEAEIESMIKKAGVTKKR